MQIGASKANAQLWESPRDYLGRLTTTGKGVGVVVLDDGFDTNHPDLKDRVAATVGAGPEDVFDHDAVGHGTHVLGIVGGDGKSSGGRIQGVAPEANLIAMKMNLDQKADWKQLSDQFARSVYWAVQNKEEFNIKVINCSFLLPMVEMTNPATQTSFMLDPLDRAIKTATEAGISIVAGVGNFGDRMAISTPAGHPDVIAVGALDTAGTPQDPGDDQVAKFSSRGRSISGEIKPDLVAPGVRIMSTNAPGCQLEEMNTATLAQARRVLSGSGEEVRRMAQEQVDLGRLPGQAMILGDDKLRKILLRCFDAKASAGEHNGHPLYLAQDGSSMASPVVAGVVAHMYEANPNLTPAQVKEILTSTARPLPGSPAEAQGHGALRAEEAIAAAARLAQAAV